MSLSNAGYEKTLHQLEIVLNHIMDHFHAEEQILKNVGYPDHEIHAAIHKDLIHKALQLKESYQNKKLKASAFFSFLFDDIIIGHMLDSDREFFSYIRCCLPCNRHLCPLSENDMDSSKDSARLVKKEEKEY